uniref:Uncharacterized protein n=1 Tax=Pipistrellus kuhlii TaxID=59472 RepID=A0A7J7YX30_PIPKU|nr:hypothetical protein mPipKuh1_009817 [Pipistrellus kuhlii]
MARVLNAGSTPRRDPLNHERKRKNTPEVRLSERECLPFRPRAVRCSPRQYVFRSTALSPAVRGGFLGVHGSSSVRPETAGCSPLALTREPGWCDGGGLLHWGPAWRVGAVPSPTSPPRSGPVHSTGRHSPPGASEHTRSCLVLIGAGVSTRWPPALGPQQRSFQKRPGRHFTLHSMVQRHRSRPLS